MCGGSSSGPSSNDRSYKEPWTAYDSNMGGSARFTNNDIPVGNNALNEYTASGGGGGSVWDASPAPYTPSYDPYNPVYSDYYSGINPSPGLPSLYNTFPQSMGVPYRALPEGMGWPVDGGSPTNPFPYAEYSNVPAQQFNSDIYQPADRGVPTNVIANVPVGGDMIPPPAGGYGNVNAGYVPGYGLPDRPYNQDGQTPEEIDAIAARLRAGDPNAPAVVGGDGNATRSVQRQGQIGGAGGGSPLSNPLAGATNNYNGPGFTTGAGLNYSRASINSTPPGWLQGGVPWNTSGGNNNNNNNKSSDDKKAGGFNMAETLGKLATSGISSALSAYGPAAQSQSAMMEQQRQMLADASVADNARRAEQTRLFSSASNDYQNIMSPEDRYKRAYGDVITSYNTGNTARSREAARTGHAYGANEMRRGNVLQYAAADTAGNAASDNAAATRMRAAGTLSGMYPSPFNPQIASGYSSLANSYGTRAAATSRGIGEMAGLATTGLFNSQFMKNRLNAPTSTTDETS